MFKKVLEKLKITTLNEMQLASLEAAKERDVVLLSPTGSGKTLGFLLPLLERLMTEKDGVQALVLVPSRELALQIEQVFRQMGSGHKVSCCYGGHSTRTEKNSLAHAPALLVGTPGRIAYHIRHGNFDTEGVHSLVLDEFDKSLEFGFQDDMSFIIRSLPGVKKRILTSATRMPDIPAFTGLRNEVEIDFLDDKPSTPDLKLKVVISESTDKLDTLFSLICKIGSRATLVFCNHRDAVERISGLLRNKGLEHDIFHGGMEQEDRERALLKFRNGSHKILITTDLASRGLDIPEIEYVIHYQMPNEQAFIHRNGRTARMNAKGTAYLILTAGEKISFLKQQPEIESLPKKNLLPPESDWTTLYIAAGKKDKVNKVDIVGLLLKKGELHKDELGLIEVLDHSSYAAVKRSKVDRMLHLIRDEKIKNRKIKMEISV